MATTTQALVVPEVKGGFQLQDISVGPITPDEALVEIQAVGLCHTDLSVAEGILPCSFPAVFGHEGAGIVKQVGANCKDLAVGDKVLLSFSSCGACDQCNTGHPAYCYEFVPLNFGGKRADGSVAIKTADGAGDIYSSFFGQSSFARLSVVHRSSIVKVRDDANLDLLAPLGCGLQTGAGSVLNTLNVTEGSSVAIFGVGGVGMSAVMAAKLRKAKVIIAVDLQQSRLDLAKKLGATHTILGNEEDIVAKVHQIAPPNGVNFAVDCSGAAKVVETMLDCIGTRGRAASVGAPSVSTQTRPDEQEVY